MTPTHLSGDHRLAEAFVHVVDEEPGTPIRHAERDPGLADRTSVADRLQESDFAGADRPVFAEIDAQSQPRRCQFSGLHPLFRKNIGAGRMVPSNQSEFAEPRASVITKDTIAARTPDTARREPVARRHRPRSRRAVSRR